MSKRNEERGSAHSFCTQGDTRPPCCTGLQRFKIKAPSCMQSAVESRNTANHAEDPTIKRRGGSGLNARRLYGGGGLKLIGSMAVASSMLIASMAEAGSMLIASMISQVALDEQTCGTVSLNCDTPPRREKLSARSRSRYPRGDGSMPP